MRKVWRRVVFAAALGLAASAGAAAHAATSILFIGNSFTFGALSAARIYKAETVHDLNNEGIGGVPAMFKALAREAGYDYDVSLETIPGSSFQDHYERKRALIDRHWDAVVLQGYSTVDRERPGDPTSYARWAGELARMFRARNPKVTVDVTATWSRADQTYLPTGHWHGKPIEAMAQDVRVAANHAKAAAPEIGAVVPVGEAWNRAFLQGIADPNPYDGIAYGQIDLWTWDQYHASVHGYYLEALVLLGTLTRHDPRLLGENETVAADLGISPAQARALQLVAWEQLQAEGHLPAQPAP